MTRQAVVVTQGCSTGLENHFAAIRVVPEQLGSFHAVSHLLNKRVHPRRRDRQVRLAIFRVSHLRGVVRQTCDCAGDDLAGVSSRALGGRRAELGMTRCQFVNNFPDVAAVVGTGLD